MGLLDDAIREHLELKRLRGADPGAVTREEHEALGPLGHDDVTHHAQDEAYVEMPASESGDSFFTDDDDGAVEGSPTIGEETVEIDMSAVLDPAVEHDLDAHGTRADHGQDSTDPVGHPAHAPGAEESLEWEIPDEKQDERGGDHEDHLSAEPGGVDDVLEETPDFLRETPEQERLWFEQRPPRDFDFNE